MYRSLLSRDPFAEMDRLQRQLQQSFDIQSPSIRGFAGGFPALNVGSTPTSVEIYAFAAGVDPSRIEVDLERGVLTIEGERASTLPADDGKSTVHLGEPFDGRFRRVLSLPDDVDASATKASYRDGVLHISVPKQQAAQPRRIEVH